MFVANFVGEREILFLDGSFRAPPQGLAFETCGIMLPLGPDQGGCAALQGRPVVLGVRAEALAIVAAGDPCAFPGVSPRPSFRART